MKLLKPIMLLLLGALCYVGVAGQNVSLNILTLNSGKVPVGGVVDIQVSVGNTEAAGGASIPTNRVRAQIDIPIAIAHALPNAEQTGLPQGWVITVNTGGRITVCNGSDAIGPSEQRQIFIKVQGDVIGGPSTVNGLIVFSSGTSCTTPGSALPGDNPADNTSQTSIEVIAGQACNLAVSASAGTIACNGGSATLTATATGAGGTVEYSLTGGAPFQSSNTFSVTAGTYTVTAREINNTSCTATATAVVVNQPSQVIASATSAPCVAGSAIVTVTATGGTAPYTGTGTFSKTTGTYNFTVTDANGCTANAQAAVSCAAACNISLSTAVTNVSCNGGNNGSINLTVNGAMAPVSYSWSNQATTEDITGLIAGTYTVRVTDVNNCTATATATVTQPATALSASEQHTTVSCFGGSSTVTISATGGTAPYSGTGTFSRTAGSYSFTVTDANGCTALANATINQPQQLSASTAASACVAGTAVVTVTASGGTAPYAGTGTFSRTNGTYNFTVTDANGCTATTQATVNCAAGCNITLSTAVTNVSCNGGNNGSINLTVNGATSPITYSWSNGATTEDINGLIANTYTVMVTDVNNCTATATATVTQPATPLSASEQHTSVSCFGGSSTVTINAAGGTAPYSGTGTFSRTAGSYSFTVTDANGCTALANVTINQPPQFSASASSSACIDGAAVVTVNATGGTAPYTGTGTFSRTSGSYSFTVTDANGCSATTQATVNCAAGCNITLSTAVTNVSCNGGNNGSINLTVNGATAPITYSWSNGATTEDINGLVANTYTVMVTDVNNCTATATATVTQPATALSASEQHTSVSCFGGSSTVTISATGGTAPYIGTGTFSRTAGSYSFIVTDANGCTALANVTINEPSQLSASASSSACVDGSAVVTVNATGGTAPYTGTGTFSRTSGSYSFTVTDANGCTATAQTTVNCAGGCNITLSTAVTNVSCNGGNNGSINLTVNGATASITYSWNNGATTEDISGVPAGTYTVTVTDAAGCTASTTATVTQPSQLSASATSAACVAGTAVVTVNASGGTAPYTGTGTVSRTTGTYNFTVTDANGCSATTQAIINCAVVCNLSASERHTSIDCFGGSSTVTISASGGTAPYTGTGTFSRTAGIYIFTVTDVASCTATVAATVTQPPQLVASSTSTACVQGTAVVTVTASGGTAPYTGTGTFSRTAGSFNFIVTDANGCSATTLATVNCVIDVTCGDNDKVAVCHNGLTLCISADAVAAHLAHGDVLGSCQNPKVIGRNRNLSSPIRVYPNPATKFVTLEWNPGNDSKSTVKVYDVHGKIVIQKLYTGLLRKASNVKQIRLEGLAQGIYFLQVSAEGEVKTTRFIIH